MYSIFLVSKYVCYSLQCSRKNTIILLLFLWKIDDYFGYLRQHTLIKGQGGLKSRGSKAFVAAEYTEQGYTDCLRPKPKTFN